MPQLQQKHNAYVQHLLRAKIQCIHLESPNFCVWMLRNLQIYARNLHSKLISRMAVSENKFTTISKWASSSIR